MTTFTPGSLVRARGREWIVLPHSTDDLLQLRPLGGGEDETCGIYLPLEPVEPARFESPTPNHLGDHRSGRLLREAARLNFRAGAGPFRSFGSIAVEPRPYQLVPLMLALRQDPVRLLIADDVGIGKTIEALLIAKELLERGEARRLAVLCPPHLAEQWEREMRAKFHLHAEVVLSSTARRLERDCHLGQSIFERYERVIVSTDYIKSDRHRQEFLRAAPELVIVDEAHTCAPLAGGRGNRHLRHELLDGLARDPARHLVLVTATPHSGDDAAFQSLLALLHEDVRALPDDLTGEHHRKDREKLARFFVQRRRGDIVQYLDEDTPFPAREEKEVPYRLCAPYRAFFRKVLEYARERIGDEAGGPRRQRVRWWSMLALLRCLASSPAAAAETLRNRSQADRGETVDAVDQLAQRSLMDEDERLGEADADLVDGSLAEDEADERASASERKRLRELAHEAEALAGEHDAKLQECVKLVKALLKDGFRPIVFCRFIPTARYVGRLLAEKLPNRVAVDVVTGDLPPTEREDRIEALAGREGERVLVCTDCLSEGINLQHSFDAVLHYDLSWNPTRHEQREGRVDRFGQTAKTVRIVTLYGRDNAIDGAVIRVLLEKHKKIRAKTGVSVPVPRDLGAIAEALREQVLLLGGQLLEHQSALPGFEEHEATQQLDDAWEQAAEREKRSRTLFAQETLQPAEVKSHLDATRRAIGSSFDVERFVTTALQAIAPNALRREKTHVAIALAEAPADLRELSEEPTFRAVFQAARAVPRATLLDRTHPFVEGLASHLLETALDDEPDAPARRAGVIRTQGVAKRTTLLLLRLRAHLLRKVQDTERPLLVEDLRLVAFEGSPANATFLEPAATEALLDLEPHGNVPPDQARAFLQKILQDLGALRDVLARETQTWAEETLAAHRRVREAARAKGAYRIEAEHHPDVLAGYLYLPASPGGPA